MGRDTSLRLVVLPPKRLGSCALTTKMGDHDKSKAPGFQCDPSKRKGAYTRHQASEREREKGENTARDVPGMAHYRKSICTETVKSGVTQRNVSCVSRKNIPPLGRREETHLEIAILGHLLARFKTYQYVSWYDVPIPIYLSA